MKRTRRIAGAIMNGNIAYGIDSHHIRYMGDTLIATTGYSYDDWRGPFYPVELPKEEFLRYYALFFPFVELGFTYYSMPNPSRLAAMAARTPSGFRFAIRAHRSLVQGVGWREDAVAFAQAADALATIGRLVAVLVELPPGFRYTPDNRNHLADLLATLSHVPVIVGFADDEWRGERVYDELDRRGVGLVLADRPDAPTYGPSGERVTGGRAYLRLRGRNAVAWWADDASSRYDYLYAKEALETIAARLRSMSRTSDIFVAFGNHGYGNAVRNAGELKDMLTPIERVPLGGASFR